MQQKANIGNLRNGLIFPKNRIQQISQLEHWTILDIQDIKDKFQTQSSALYEKNTVIILEVVAHAQFCTDFPSNPPVNFPCYCTLSWSTL